jgi:hypothetical protein
LFHVTLSIGNGKGDARGGAGQRGGIWQAYRARYWPSPFLIDKRGHLRYTHIGEGAYGETEQAIRDLLKED